MFTVTECRYRIAGLCLLALAAGAQAEPYLAVKTNQPCMTCHINPTGGGARNSYGAFYGSQMLPATPGNVAAFDDGQLTSMMRVGGDWRFQFTQMEQDEAETHRGFNTQSGQIYVTLTPRDSRFLLHIDQQLAPGGTRNREAFVLMRLGNRHYLKAGNLFLPYGLRLQDDTAFIREASQVNFANSEQGTELGLAFDNLYLTVAVTNGTSQSSNNDARLHYLSRVEYIGKNWRMGGGYGFNHAALGERHMANVFGGFTLADIAFLLEVAHFEDRSVSNLPDTYERRRLALLEANWGWRQGYNLKLTTEFMDPDTHLANNHRYRHSLLLEATPYAHVQWQAGVRVGEDSPERPQGNFTYGFWQVHFYY